MNYGETALGVECALPRAGAAAPHSRARRFIEWIASALRRLG